MGLHEGGEKGIRKVGGKGIRKAWGLRGAEVDVGEEKEWEVGGGGGGTQGWEAEQLWGSQRGGKRG